MVILLMFHGFLQRINGNGSNQARYEYTNKPGQNSKHPPCRRHRRNIAVADSQAGDKTEIQSVRKGYLFKIADRRRIYSGVVKDENEDRYLIKPLADGTILLALADGLGGDVSGDFAAEIACGTFAGIDRISAGQEEAELKKMFCDIDLTVYEQTEKDPELAGMGSTLICVLLRGNQVFWAHAGDSRLYFLTRGRLARVTRDQMLSRFLVEEGEISAEQARSHYSRNVMDQYIGCGFVEPETGSLERLPDDILMLATDGLHRQISLKDLQALLNTTKPLEDRALTLIQAAIDAGGEDNITVVLATGFV